MKFGYCVGMAATDAAGIGYERIPVLQRLGFDYAELPLAQVMSLKEPAFLDGPLAAVERCGLPCLRMNNFFPGSFRLTGPEADHESALRYARAALERAARLGATVVVFGSSGARNVPCHASLRDGLAQLASLLSRLAPIAASFGIVIAVEHLNRMESNLVNRFSQGCALARKAGHENIGALLDTYHLNVSGESLASVLKGGALLRHVHVARTLGRTLPCPGDHEDYGALFEVLRRIGYDGCVSLEAYARQDFESEAQAALSLLRTLAGP